MTAIHSTFTPANEMVPPVTRDRRYERPNQPRLSTSGQFKTAEPWVKRAGSVRDWATSLVSQ